MTAPDLADLRALLDAAPDARWLESTAWQAIPAPLRAGYARQADKLSQAIQALANWRQSISQGQWPFSPSPSAPRP